MKDWNTDWLRQEPDEAVYYDLSDRVRLPHDAALKDPNKLAALSGECVTVVAGEGGDVAKVILDLCGGTGAWSKPYRDAGYDVHVITLPQYDVTRVTIDRYGIVFHDAGQRDRCLGIQHSEIYGILAAPPCTEFSVAKGARPRDFREGMVTVHACLRIIWAVRMHGSLKFWALENPVGFLRQFLGIPSFTFEHWEFGDSNVKPTDIWGYFNPPRKTVAQKPDGLSVQYANRRNGRGMAAPKCPPEYSHLGLDRASLRAITPAGFAQAFFKANK